MSSLPTCISAVLLQPYTALLYTRTQPDWPRTYYCDRTPYASHITARQVQPSIRPLILVCGLFALTFSLYCSNYKLKLCLWLQCAISKIKKSTAKMQMVKKYIHYYSKRKFSSLEHLCYGLSLLKKIANIKTSLPTVGYQPLLKNLGRAFKQNLFFIKVLCSSLIDLFVNT